MILLDKKYSSEGLQDLSRDVDESFDGDYNPEVYEIPKDEHGFHKGTFRVVIEWISE